MDAGVASMGVVKTRDKDALPHPTLLMFWLEKWFTAVAFCRSVNTSRGSPKDISLVFLAMVLLVLTVACFSTTMGAVVISRVGSGRDIVSKVDDVVCILNPLDSHNLFGAGISWSSSQGAFKPAHEEVVPMDVSDWLLLMLCSRSTPSVLSSSSSSSSFRRAPYNAMPLVLLFWILWGKYRWLLSVTFAHSVRTSRLRDPPLAGIWRCHEGTLRNEDEDFLRAEPPPRPNGFRDFLGSCCFFIASGCGCCFKV